MQQQNDRSIPQPGSVSSPNDAEDSSRLPELGLVRASPSTDLVPKIRQGTTTSPSTTPSTANPDKSTTTAQRQQASSRTSQYDHGHARGPSTSTQGIAPSLISHSPLLPAVSRQPAQIARDQLHSQQPLSRQTNPGGVDLYRSRSRAKRSSSRQTVPDSVMEPSPVKKPRTGASPPRMSDLPNPPVTAEQAQVDGPTSPLFFSHTAASKHFNRLAAFHTSDPSASLLARMREESAGAVTTLKLPRANINSPSPARSGSTPGSWGSSMDTSAPALTPDARPLAPALQGLGGVDLIELLDQDIRPTFLVDLSNPANNSRPGLHILFYNLTLRTSHPVLRLLTVDQDDTTAATDFGAFKAWILTSMKGTEGQELPLPPHKYGGITWTCSTLRKRFRFVSGNASVEVVRSQSPIPMTETPAVLDQPGENPSPAVPLTPEAAPIDPPDYFGAARRKSGQSDSIIEELTAESIPDASDAWNHPDEFANELLQAQTEKPSFDWTRIPLTENLPEHIRFVRTVDWGATALGPIEDWPNELRAISNLVMGSPHPAALYWGPQNVVLYNAAYIDLAGQKHPSLMGQQYSEAWAEIWSELEPIFQAAWESGQATMKNDNHLFINRSGFLEEAFFSWSIVPLLGADGEVVGLYNPAFDNTRRKVTERQMLALREIGERTVLATTMKGFWPQVQKGLEYNSYDVPFALIYSVKDDTESEASSFHSSSYNTPQLLLEGAIGVPEGHVCAIDNLDLRTSEEGFAPYMRQSMASGGMVIVLSEEDGTMPKHLIENLDWRGFGDPCRTIVVFPVMPTTVGEAVVGFIVMGANPRRPYDDDYKLFIHLLTRQLATSMASVVLFEEEIKRGQRAARLAAMDRLELAKQLQLKSQEADESEYKFARMAEFAPVGMFIANSEGLINYCNDMFWQISRVPPGNQSENGWMNYVQDEDRPVLEEAWMRLLNQKVTISVEFRFKCSQRNGGNTIDTWVLMSALPEKAPDGNLKGMFGCITDISSQKWAEKVQSERREEAVELKRQQENFIDITSHEMRNPLSAILQCADQIANSITAFANHHIREEVETLLESCLDAANTINLCASHQKRIVDDILTLSKLDSNLLSVTPIDEQPVRVIQRALKMFESELVANDIEFEFRVDKSFDTYGIKWARLDPSRLRQILINLMTNAIKFTQTREKRNIIVSLAASKNISEVTKDGIHYFARNNDNMNATMDIDNESEWGSGERINIHCSVEDSGPGLGDEELKILFQRFRQATPRTHVQYGGSGLGLFISRILTEMQGGQIGVISEPGMGSKFCFYIQSRICVDPPNDSYEHISPFRIARKIRSPASNPLPPPSQPRSTADEQGNPLFDVLIVEDNIVNQKVLQRQLRSFGNNTFVANHGKEALQTLRRSRYWAGQEDEGMDISVILMDLEMPVMDGMTCARRIRELEKEGTIIQHIPIIAVTAYARPEQIESAKAAGIDDVISKPFRIPDLMPKIEELVGKYKKLSVSNSD